MAQDEKSIIRSLSDPTIAIDEISFVDTEEGTSNRTESNKKSKFVGNAHPLIVLNGYVVSADEIEKLHIDSTGFLPEVQFTMNISNPTFISTSIPKDGDRLNVFIRARNDAFKPIRNDYLITNVDTTKSLNSAGDGMIITITGELFIPKIHDELIKSHKGTSYSVLQSIADELGLGFASNETETSDEQTWICPNDKYLNYINHICDSAWKDENSFYTCFIDIYYHLNFVNINNQFSDSTEIDDGLIDLLVADDSLEGEKLSNIVAPKVFTNISDKEGTPSFIKNYKLINRSSDISKKFGYKMHCEFFEHNSLEKWDIFSEPLIVEGEAAEKIVLKGKAGEDHYKTQIKRRWGGLQYTLPEHNVHEKYLYARVHNLMNIQETNKMQVQIEVPRANFNIYRGERIPCVFIVVGEPMRTTFLQSAEEKKGGGDEELANSYGAPTTDKFYSGFYMIAGMTFTYVSKHPQDPSIRGFFSEDVVLTRRTWPTP